MKNEMIGCTIDSARENKQDLRSKFADHIVVSKLQYEEVLESVRLCCARARQRIKLGAAHHTLVEKRLVWRTWFLETNSDFRRSQIWEENKGPF